MNDVACHICNFARCEGSDKLFRFGYHLHDAVEYSIESTLIVQEIKFLFVKNHLFVIINYFNC